MRDADHGTTEPPRTVTIREAAELCGMSRDAMRGRVERGSVQNLMGQDGVRRIPVSELRRTGLLDRVSDRASSHATGHGMAGDGMGHDVSSVGAFVDVFQKLHAENVAAVARAVAAETRLQIEQSSASTTELELHEARARIVTLELQLDTLQVPADTPVAEQRRPWFGITRRRK